MSEYTRDKMELYYKLKSHVEQQENYVPRNYQTIGGMWTTETYKLGDVTLQIMDEGYSARLFTQTSVLDIHESCRYGQTEVEFRAGSVEDLAALLAVMGL